MIGSTPGGFIDNAPFGSGGANVKAGKIEDLRVQELWIGCLAALE